MLESQIAVLAGDLAEAERIARQAVRAVAREPSELEHRRPFMLLVQLLQEVGNDKEAAEIADRFLSSREALMRTPAHSIWYDQTPLLLKAKLRGGLLDEEGYVAARDEWIRGWEERLPASLRGALWLVGYSAPTTSPEDAREALQALPAYAPPPTPWGSFRLEPGPGKVYLLAGDAASATPHLASLVDSCSALKAPVAHTMAAYYLGMAREAQGEVAGACAAYKMVLQRWARAKASTTAASARERASALQCNM
jgi:serine/threonine-protein kinase